MRPAHNQLLVGAGRQAAGEFRAYVQEPVGEPDLFAALGRLHVHGKGSLAGSIVHKSSHLGSTKKPDVSRRRAGGFGGAWSSFNIAAVRLASQSARQTPWARPAEVSSANPRDL